MLRDQTINWTKRDHPAETAANLPTLPGYRPDGETLSECQQTSRSRELDLAPKRSRRLQRVVLTCINKALCTPYGIDMSSPSSGCHMCLIQDAPESSSPELSGGWSSHQQKVVRNIINPDTVFGILRVYLFSYVGYIHHTNQRWCRIRKAFVMKNGNEHKVHKNQTFESGPATRGSAPTLISERLGLRRTVR
ncbi:uncharacterized protein CIMG_10074 [Coccidioides immitis RS]|uniref:Uncharacterized protein n=4 Tax=Coccidioides immitis TaxID=5501 RepID=J3K0S0_COCIM|nr:uncharacterized protein CIMG_10074 [Coccidioides immitis RS]EAS27469.3 hypothetical protein CIMG_10074 [Coccidioides immitis RS]KMP09427.1 hypothetical protein CIRG_09597 [Coccidioides immitis RMSCC 2394]KMU75360.1 hypothetical protein CISG_04779 [Coccidioides immitis RMSCC 3703]KMU88516.1 hypothetical protein CIHG_06316 [Coccidioides immitis H538.4]